MDWLRRWWAEEIVAGSKGPLLLVFVAFVVTFITTRTITRLIRAGRGPFRNITNGGVHLHHSTPGVILLVTGAFCAVGAEGGRPWNYLGAALVGVGASLVLDEFAMIFHLQDVYWSEEGQLSVNVVTLSAACLGLAITGVSPNSLPWDADSVDRVRGGVTAVLAVHLFLVVVAALKGKYPTALLGIFFSPLVWVGAVRLARPRSPWARRFYSPAKVARATERETSFDARWGQLHQWWADFIGGRPSQPDPPPTGSAG
ncbi:MAG: hypothetical protein IPH03_06595 [Tetrasphaera sp.]|jgi:hypothetical protein|nr:hypothetical protein [Tetrasphaera sp.]